MRQTSGQRFFAKMFHVKHILGPIFTMVEHEKTGVGAEKATCKHDARAFIANGSAKKHKKKEPTKPLSRLV